MTTGVDVDTQQLDQQRTQLDRILDGTARGVHSVYQPIVDLATGAIVAFEALGRGPVGSSLEMPDQLFRAAVQARRITDLDWACRRAAYRGAAAAGLAPNAPLFINVEPATLGEPEPPGSDELIAASSQVQIILEVTERAIATRPAELLRALRRARALGCAIAIDDLGAEPASLALLPLISPEIIKLDMGLLHARPTVEVAAVMTAALAEAERTGATVLAEGIETPDHFRRARALGAQLGQGYLFGRPGPIAEKITAGVWNPPASSNRPFANSTPFHVVAPARDVRESTKEMLVAMSHHLEEQAAALPTPGVILSAFQDAAHFTPATAVRYSRLGQACSLVAALGVGLTAEPVAGVRGATLAEDDPLLHEWSVVVVGAHYAAALVARDLGDRGLESDRRFLYALTHDRELVLRAADTLIDRIVS